jgi:hypothetical protein
MSIKIDQALITQFIGGGFLLPVAHENLPYTPVAGTAYAELLVLNNDTTPYSLKDSNATDGVFRIILRYPVDGGAVAIKTKADEIFAAFKVGQRLTYSGQTLTITSQQRQPGVAEDGWYKLVLTISYQAFITR